MEIRQMQDLTHENSPALKRVLLLLNPASRNGARHIQAISAWLKQHHYTVIVPQTSMQNGPTANCIESNAQHIDLVIVGGGDGSINSALPALMKHKLPLLVLPLGTANSLARSLGLPNEITEALSLIEKGRITWIDVGLANGIPFLSVVGLGLSTQVNRMVRDDHKRWLGVFAFIWTALNVFARMSPFKVNIICNGVAHRSKSWQVSVCNGKYYGSRLTIAEEASLTDNLLHGVSSEMQRWWKGLLLIPSLLFGRYGLAQELTAFQGTQIRIETRRSMSVDVDGDIRTRTPVEISVCPRALRIFVPRNQEGIFPAH